MTCIFCSIAGGEVPAEIVASSDHAVAFRDLNPQAPTHVLVIPRRHFASVVSMAAHPDVLGAVMALAVEVSEKLGVAESGFRLVANTGDHGGQTVHHMHLHVLGGRPMRWPPG